jgi:hypothetical protein
MQVIDMDFSLPIKIYRDTYMNILVHMHGAEYE